MFQEENELLKRKNGVTLVMLTVIIVIMIILASTALYMSFTNGGLVDRAGKAQHLNAKSLRIEELKKYAMANYMKKSETGADYTILDLLESIKHGDYRDKLSNEYTYQDGKILSDEFEIPVEEVITEIQREKKKTIDTPKDNAPKEDTPKPDKPKIDIPQDNSRPDNEPVVIKVEKQEWKRTLVTMYVRGNMQIVDDEYHLEQIEMHGFEFDYGGKEPMQRVLRKNVIKNLLRYFEIIGDSKLLGEDNSFRLKSLHKVDDVWAIIMELGKTDVYDAVEVYVKPKMEPQIRLLYIEE